MLQLIKTALLLFINDIDSGNSNITEKLQEELLSLLLLFNLKELSKLEAAEYIGVSRATFDNYINNVGFKELSWKKCDLDKFLNNKKF